MGLGRSYRVIIDCKTSASGSVGDSQVDWVTLDEHKALHDADYVAVVAPRPVGRSTLRTRADKSVVVISVDELVALLNQHGQAPLDLEAYRSLFMAGEALLTRMPSPNTPRTG